MNLIRFVNPILRQNAEQLSVGEIKNEKIQELIEDIRALIESEAYGVGLAAPQVGESLALSVISIKPTPNRPNLERFEQVIINPTYEGIGRRSSMWEGCLSSGEGDNTLFAKALRYQKIHATWYDENAEFHDKILDGFVAHVFQHETDHLGGILFVDKVRDTTTYMLADEYRKRIVKK